MRYLAIGMGYLMKFLYDFIGNYGITIIVLTVIVRACLIPLYSKQQKSMAKMQELQPKINEIQTRYANDKEKMNEKLNEVYSEAGQSPLSGCLPMLIQFPIIIGLYTLLRSPLEYMAGAESMVAAVHEGFLWVTDLCQTDPWILPILAGLTTFFTFTSQQENQASSGAANVSKAMKYFFPVMIFLMGRTFPAGLALYWTVGNLVTWAQTGVINKKTAKERLKKEVKEEVIKSRKEARGK